MNNVINNDSDIAIIGMACRFPDAENYDTFWKNLNNGTNSIREVDHTRWDFNNYNLKENVCKSGSFLKDVDTFDNRFFNISPNESLYIDPQQRILLEEVWHCIEDANIKLTELQGGGAGVFVGVMATDYQQRLLQSPAKTSRYECLGNYQCIIANRISHFLGLSGPSEAIDAACSSSVVALHNARLSLLFGESSYAFVAGVNIICHPWKYISFSKSHMLSLTGNCRPFDKNADGYVPGEGVGVILITPLSQARKKGYKIWGIIKESTVNHAGRTLSPSAPSIKQQAEVVRLTYQKAHIGAENISYIEAHGTGTSLGDPIEVEALCRAFNTTKKQFCFLGSAKSNIGHLEAAAGIAGIIKVLLMMKYRKIPKTINITTPNPIINFKQTPFILTTESHPWVSVNKSPRYAGVSSFGFGGVNTHVLLQENIFFRKTSNKKRGTEKQQYYPIIFSAKSFFSFQKIMDNWSNLENDFFHTNSLWDISNALLNRRHFFYREYFLVSSKEELIDRLLQQKSNKNSYLKKQYKLVFFLDSDFTVNNFDALYENVSSFKSSVDDCLVLLPDKNTINVEEWFKGMVSQSEKELFAFICLYGICKTLISYECNPSVIVDRTTHGLLGLVLAEAYELKRALLCLTTDKEEFDTIRIKPPTIPVYHVQLKKMILPVHVSNSYLADLMERLCVNKEELIRLKEKADILYRKQFTFIHYIQEWEHALSLIGFSINNFFTEDVASWPDIKQKLFFIIVSVSIRRLYKKWNLMDEKSKSKPFEELFNLIEDQILTFKDVIKFIFKQDQKETKEELALKVNKSWDKIDLTKEYAILKQNNKYPLDLKVVSDHKEEMKDLDIFNDVNAFVPDMFFLGLGQEKSVFLNSLCFNLCIKEKNNILYNWYDFLLRIWKYNILINLEKVFTDLFGNKRKFSMNISLPSYPFDKEKYWIEMKKDIQDLQRQEERGKISIMNNKAAVSEISDLLIEQETLSTMNYYRKTWEVQKGNYFESHDVNIKEVLLFDVNEIVYRNLKGLGIDVCLVKPGKRYKKISEKIYEININKAQDYLSTLHDISKSSIPQYIIHKFSSESFVPKKTSIDRQLQTGFYSFSYLVKGLIPYKKKYCLLYAYIFDSKINPTYEMLSGLIKTLCKEQHNILCKIIGLERGIEKKGKILLKELDKFEQGFISARYKNNIAIQKEVMVYQRHVFNEEKETSIKKGGVYIVTGGLGGLGMVCSQYILEQGGKVILIGRSELTKEKREKYDQLSALGVASYYRGDVKNKKDIQRFIMGAKTHYGKISGVIHAAGMLRDKLFLNQKEAEIEEVFSSKIYGTVYLDEALAEENLDFFVVFSSVISWIGNIGQTAYGSANSFLDHYIEYRAQQEELKLRKGKSLSINWPFWVSGGMVMESTRQRYLEKEIGLYPFPNKRGIEGLKTILKGESGDYSVLFGKENKIDGHLKISEMVNKKIKPQLCNQKTPKEKQSLLKQLNQEIKLEISGLLEVHINDLDDGSTFGEYGVDSLTLEKLSEILNEKYGILTTPIIFFDNDTIETLCQYLYNEYYELVCINYRKKDGGQFGQKLKKIEEKDEQCKAILNIQSVNHAKEMRMRESVAIIGMSGIFPKSNNLNEFWERLERNEDCITEIPKDRWDWEEYYGDITRSPDKTNSKWGGFINDVDKFDAAFFGISPREAELMDPQHRLFLQTAYHSIEDAGYALSKLSGQPVGVFVGAQFNDYEELYGKYSNHAYFTTGTSHTMLANRISYLFDFHGPSETINTACSSSLIAVDAAVSNLCLGKCNLAIAGGVSLSLNPRNFIIVSQLGILSPTGRCKVFDARADGYVKGEGIGAVLLKPLSMAIQDGDNIYGIIRGSAANHGGKANSLTAPNAKAQRDLLLKVYRESRVDVRKITYIETHGTGTALGDPIEIEGLKMTFTELLREDYKSNSPYCAIGAVKSNIGHLESASGIAGLIKVLSSMKYGKLPGNPQLHEINPYINLNSTPFYLLKKTEEWKRLEDEEGKEVPRIAGVSSFGFGGANAHVLVEEWLEEKKGRSKEQLYYLIAISAKTEDSLKVKAKELYNWLKENNEAEIRDISYTLLVGRDHFSYRNAIVVESKNEAIKKIEAILRGDKDGYFKGKKESKENKQINVIVFKEIVGKLLEQSSRTHYKEIVDELAFLYVEGADFPWEEIYRNDEVIRMSLPKYPFVRESYWFEGEFPKKEKFILGCSNNLDSYPLLDEEVFRTDKEIQYKKKFTGEELYIEDHKIDDIKILPGVVYLEIAQEIGQIEYSGQKIFSMSDISWLNALKFYNKPREIFVSLNAHNEEKAFEIFEDTKCKKVIFAKGKIIYDDFKNLKSCNIKLDEVKGRFTKIISKENYYKLTNQIGHIYGPAFRITNWVMVNQQEAFGQILLDNSLLDNKGYNLHPSVFDAALGVALVLEYFNAPFNVPLIPFYMKSISVLRNIPNICYMHVSYSQSKNRQDLDVRSFNFALYDEEGRVILKISEFVSKFLNHSSKKTSTAEGKACESVLKYNKGYNEKNSKILQQHCSSDKKVYQKIIQFLGSLLSSMLRVSEDSLSPNKNFDELGIDSILILDLTQRLEQHFPKLPRTLFFECTNLNELTNYFIKEYTPQVLSIVENKIEKTNASEQKIVSNKNPNEARARLFLLLKEIISFAVKVPIGEIDEDTSFESIGIDSVLILDLSQRLEKQFGHLPRTLFFECRNINELADYLIKNEHTSINKRDI